MRYLFYIPTRQERETRNRIRLSVWAYAYELESTSLVSDAVFDEACKKVDLSISTTRPELDKWWVENFKPWTGQWIHSHPNLKRIKELYHAYYHKS